MVCLPKNKQGCPYLLLAPMEGVGDKSFRLSMVSVGGMDEVVRDFLRVPANAHVSSLARVYDAKELGPLPLAAQLMGSDATLMAEMAREVERRGALHIDLNCGCPSNTVTGRGAGSSLLKNPNQIYEVSRAMVQAVSVPVTVKMRSGFEDTSLFKENLLAAQDSGAQYVTLHPRTKRQGYESFARWELIAEAKALLRIPVVGNGDILSVEDALTMLKQTRCDGLMIGRGSLINPFIFLQIKAHFAGQSYKPSWEEMQRYVQAYVSFMSAEIPEKLHVNKLKQLMGFLFKANEALLAKRSALLTSLYKDTASFLEFALPLFRSGL